MDGKITRTEAVQERRKDMLRAHFRGIPTTEWVVSLACKYGVTEIAVWQDWRRRKEWLGRVFELDDVVDEINMNMVELMQVKEEAWRTYHEAKSAQNKAIALKIIAVTIKDKIEILQSLGAVYKEPLKVEGMIGVKIEELLRVYATIADRVAVRDFPANNP